MRLSLKNERNEQSWITLDARSIYNKYIIGNTHVCFFCRAPENDECMTSHLYNWTLKCSTKEKRKTDDSTSTTAAALRFFILYFQILISYLFAIQQHTEIYNIQGPVKTGEQIIFITSHRFLSFLFTPFIHLSTIFFIYLSVKITTYASVSLENMIFTV